MPAQPKATTSSKDHSPCDIPTCAICSGQRPFVLPPELVEVVEGKQAVIFAGAGISTESRAVLPWTFYEDTCAALNRDPATAASFPDVMAEFEAAMGRRKLLCSIKERLEHIKSFDELNGSATSFHRALSTIHQLQHIVTTNWDDYFESECGATPFVCAEDFAFWDLPGRKVFKLHGSVASYGSIVATREDYERCYRQLSTELIGSSLKLALATKTIIYIGFSFRDDDFLRIHKLLNAEAGRIRPRSYIVTLDTSSNERFKSAGLVPIYTDGTYFIEVLKKQLVERGSLVPDERFKGIRKRISEMHAIHTDLANTVRVATHPEVIYALSYQDGLQDGLGRILNLMKTGCYSDPVKGRTVVMTYSRAMRPARLKRGIYPDVAYIDGYIAAHIFLSLSDEVRAEAPNYYMIKGGELHLSKTQFLRHLRNPEMRHKRAYDLARKLTRNYTDGMVFHHRAVL